MLFICNYISYKTLELYCACARGRGHWEGSSGAAAAEFFGFEDDEVFVEGLQGGVGEAGCAVEDGAAAQDHVEPLEERAAGKAIEDGFLVEAAGVEVGGAEGGG